jgi:hypothetical protein
VGLWEVFLSRCWQQSVQYRISLPPDFVGYFHKLFPWEITTESCLAG